ncbi:MAG: peptidylprolyl isomerase [candidate division Zixibacteria bacterium]|nr:peptidylprolyl isomerase [Candidatus Tariuqbacter arcticus]
MRKSILAIVFITIALSLIGQETVDRIIAVVDDEIILESEVMQYAQSLALQNRVDPVKYLQNDEIKAQILQELVDQKVLLAMAEEDTLIVVEDRELKQELESRVEMLVKEAGSEEELERLYGMPMRDIRRDFERNVRESLMVDRLRQRKLSGVKVSRAEVEDFYRSNKEQLDNRPETVELAHILLKVEPAEAAGARALALIDSVYEEVLGGADFEMTAKQLSQDLGTAKRGGLLGWTKRGDFVPEFEEAAFKLEINEISPPIRTKFGYHIIRLNERQGEKVKTSHILIRLEATEADKGRVMALADSLFTLLQGEADFGELAAAFSQDEQTASEGGNLGTFMVREMTPIYASKIKELEEGEITEPFESAMGIQILKALKRQKPRALTLDSDWEQISRMALNWEQEKVYIEWVNSLKEEVYIEIR